MLAKAGARSKMTARPDMNRIDQRFAELSAAGKKQLRSSREYWSRFAGALEKVLETSPKPA